MADEALNSFAGGTAHGLVAFLLAWIRQEKLFLEGLPRDMEKIRKELELVASFREGKAGRGERGGARAWWLLLRDAALAAEEVMDEFVYYNARSPNVRVGGSRKLFFSIFTLPEKHQIASRAQHVYTEFKDINERARSYGLVGAPTETPARGGSSHLQSQRSSFPIYGDMPLIGFDRQREEFDGLLGDGERQRVVIRVKGMGGLGKTTLAYSAYLLVRAKFECSAWITVSKSCSIQDLLKNMIRQIRGSAPVDEAMVAQELSDHLKSKKYIIVLDNMCDDHFGHDLESLFPDNNNGSRIIITTRTEHVAFPLGDNRRDFELKPMSKQHAWDLFCQVAFAGKICPEDVESSARAIVARCGGLPLAIVTTARLMASRSQTANEWRSVESRFGWYLSSQRCEVVKKVLLFSFDELPYHLKHCFLYLSIFPENFVIKKKKLVRLWIAEGFVEEQRGWTPEERAEELLEELVSKNLVEVSNKACKRTYRMHDVMRELAVWIAADERFLMVVHDGIQEKPCCRARRLSIQTRGKGSCLECTGKFHLHSIINFDKSCPIELKRMWSHSKFLRVLDLEGLRIDKCPDKLEELLNLRYLSLRKTGIKNLPHGFEKFPSLETLDLRETELQELPLGSSIKKMLPSEYVYSMYLQKLRHLYVGPSHPANSGYVVSLGIPPPQGVCEFINLQTLAHIKVDETFVTNVGKLTQLKKLGITNVREVDTEKLLLSIKKMTTLRHLSITAAPGQPLTLESASNSFPPTSIQKLMLMGKMRDQKLPTWITSLKSLTLLRLRASKLSYDPLPALRVLGSLEEIELRDAYIGKKLNFPSGSFLKLKKLQLWDLHNLEGITINQGAVPIISEMHFYNCKRLVEAPQYEGEQDRGRYDIFTADTSW